MINMEIDLCNPKKGLEDLLKLALSFNASIEDNSPSTDDSKSLENLELEEIQDKLKDLVNDLVSFRVLGC